MDKISDTTLRSIIVVGDSKDLVETALKFASNQRPDPKKTKLNSTQIRGIFNSIKQIWMSWERNPASAQHKLRMLKPRLAYQAKRNPQILSLQNVLDKSIDLVLEDNISDDDVKKRFANLTDFLEAIVAYLVSESFVESPREEGGE